MTTSYLITERELGRIAADADVDTLAPTLIGAGHLLFADRDGTPPEAGAVRKVVTTVIASVVVHPAIDRGLDGGACHTTASTDAAPAGQTPRSARRRT